MKRLIVASLLLTIITSARAFSTTSEDTLAYLITCGPGTETYSIYGHSALRILIPEKQTDIVYNWGVFDFDTPNFVWKFAKGRLDYLLDTETLKSFLSVYLYEQRFVYSQKLNINAEETRTLVSLINENLKPENRKYRYDFFYDDCSTRIRDLLEKSVGDKLRYPPSEKEKNPTFRNLVGKYQAPYPWLRFGVDLLLGSPADKKAVFRDRMFLPIDMKDELSRSLILRSGQMIPLLQNPVILVDFKFPVVKQNFFTSPPFVFTLLIIIILILAGLTKNLKTIRVIDIVIYSVFSILALMMIFFNFFTDHQQLKFNLNIIWLNPFIPVCLIMVILNKAATFWFRLIFFVTAGFLLLNFLMPQQFNVSFYLLAMGLLIRSSVRSGFEWNPLSLKSASA